MGELGGNQTRTLPRPPCLDWSTTKILLGPVWSDPTPTIHLEKRLVCGSRVHTCTYVVHAHCAVFRIRILICKVFSLSKVWVSGANVVSAFLLLLSNVFTSLTLGGRWECRSNKAGFFIQCVSLVCLGLVAQHGVLWCWPTILPFSKYFTKECILAHIWLLCTREKYSS